MPDNCPTCMMIQIRPAQLHDRDRLKALYHSAFSDVEREAVANLAVNLLAAQTTTLALVAQADDEMDDQLVGHVAFSPVTCIDADNDTGSDIGDDCGYILAPLAVHPTYQKRGIGTQLIETGLKHLADRGMAIVFVYGDPGYYGRFGFDPDLAARYAPPYQLQYEFGWQAKRLTDMGGLPPSGKLTCVPALMNPQLW